MLPAMFVVGVVCTGALREAMSGEYIKCGRGQKRSGVVDGDE